jgi:hypothetical protein
MKFAVAHELCFAVLDVVNVFNGGSGVPMCFTMTIRIE